jgi:5-hydroxyisourate hydrolase
MGKLSTHVLDTANGVPASGMGFALFVLDGGRRELVSGVTNQDGRSNQPLLAGDTLKAGRYELVFAAGDYFRARAGQLAEPLFVDEVVLRFGIAHPDQNYHVPLLVSPWSYSTYRGS